MSDLGRVDDGLAELKGVAGCGCCFDSKGWDELQKDIREAAGNLMAQRDEALTMVERLVKANDTGIWITGLETESDDVYRANHIVDRGDEAEWDLANIAARALLARYKATP